MTIASKWENDGGNGFVGAAVSEVVSAGANAIASGDFLLATVVVEANVGAITPPAGWTLLNSQVLTAGGNTVGFFYKIAGGSESGSYTFSWTGSNFAGWVLQNYGGVNATPIDVSNTSTYATAGTPNATATGISPTGAADMLLGLWVGDQATTITTPTGMTQRVASTPLESGTVQFFAADHQLSSSGATGNQSAQQGTTGFNTGAWLLAALTPAGGAAARTPTMTLMGVG